MKQKADITTDIDTSFDEHISLRNLKGQKDAVSMLTVVSEQLLNDRTAGRHPSYPSVIIFGKEGSGRRTIARALHNTLGQVRFKEAICNYGNMDDDVFRYWNDANDHTTHFINGVDNLTPQVQIQLLKLLREQRIRVVMPIERREEVIEVPNRLIILSASSPKKIVPNLLQAIDIHCHVTQYTVAELFEILKQRCNLVGWKYDEDVLGVIAAGCKDAPAKAIRLLIMSYRCMRSKNRDCLCLEDIEKAISFVPAKR